jgi:hypothetical protein
MAFPKYIVEQAFDRQNGVCGLCGKEIVFNNYELSDRGAWHAHHVNGNSKSNYLGNCVCLCINYPQNCHLTAHCNNFNGNSVLAKSQFPYWYSD